MLLLNHDIKNEIINSLNKIINIEDNSWNNLDLNLKLKVIHHYCNIFTKNNSITKNDNIYIPLKSIKPKKLIQYANFNKQYNKKLYNEYLNEIQDLTIEHRNAYINNRKYYTYSSLPKNEYNEILNKYTTVIYNFLTKYIKEININNLYNELLGNNIDKIITIKNNNININIQNNKIELIFNNIEIIMELLFASNKITNNIPVKFQLKLINKL